MAVSEKQKMCWSCEGNIPFSAETCPFCGAVLNPHRSQEQAATPSYTDYKSPYRLARPEEAEAIPIAPITKPDAQAQDDEELSQGQAKKIMMTLGSLSVGLVFLIFGLVLFLFSGSDGMLVLKWDAHYWYIYLIIGVPLLIVGWRTLGHIVDAEE